MAKYFKGGSYLDVGCFNSPMPGMLKAQFPESRIIAVDYAPEVISAMSKKYPLVEYKVADALHLPFREEFDYVVAGELIEHLESPKDLIQECLRVLKPGGILSISTPKEEGKNGKYVDRQEHLWSFDESDMLELLPDCEIEVYHDTVDVFIVWKKK
jgi:ubiquinone/menaquinone biosynthesis C-methylase UbiE